MINIIIGTVAQLLLPKMLISVFSILGTLVCVTPGTCLSIRRLHDIGKSGWYLFMSLIPIVGPFILLYWYCLPGVSGINEYGDNPKG